MPKLPYILAVIIFIGAFAYMYRDDIKSFVRPVAPLTIGHEYKVQKITVIKGDEFAVTVGGYLYHVKLNVSTIDDAKDEVADILNLSQHLNMTVKKVTLLDMFVDFNVIKDGVKFNLSSYLKEKGLVYNN